MKKINKFLITLLHIPELAEKSQKEQAELFGISPAYYSAVKHGKETPGSKTKERIYKLFKNYLPEIQYEDIWNIDR